MDQVNVKATFRDDDLFARKHYAKIGMKLIENHPTEKGACTIAIDAPWGVGKSTFLHMWINELDLGNTLMYPEPTYRSEFRGKNVLPIYYNAWENDLVIVQWYRCFTRYVLNWIKSMMMVGCFLMMKMPLWNSCPVAQASC